LSLISLLLLVFLFSFSFFFLPFLFLFLYDFYLHFVSFFSLSPQHTQPATMGRMHSFGKGISRSCLPYKRTPPAWLKVTAAEVIEQVTKLARKGLTPGQIGTILRDSHGISKVKNVTGTRILRILRSNGLAPAFPEDLYHMIKKAVTIRKHLEKNKKDKSAKFRLILTESRIHRIVRYFKRTGGVPPNWKYESSTASALVS